MGKARRAKKAGGAATKVAKKAKGDAATGIATATATATATSAAVAVGRAPTSKAGKKFVKRKAFMAKLEVAIAKKKGVGAGAGGGAGGANMTSLSDALTAEYMSGPKAKRAPEVRNVRKNKAKKAVAGREVEQMVRGWGGGG